MLVPDRFLGIRDDAGTGDPSADETEGDVRIAGDGLVVALVIAAVFGGEWMAAGGEQTAKSFRENVHVGQDAGFDDSVCPSFFSLFRSNDVTLYDGDDRDFDDYNRSDLEAFLDVHCKRREKFVQVAARCAHGYKADWSYWLGLTAKEIGCR